MHKVLRFSLVGVLSIITLLLPSFIPPVSNIAAQQPPPRPDGYYIEVVSSNLAAWLPEGHATGDSTQPSAAAKDLEITVRWGYQGTPPWGTGAAPRLLFYLTLYSSYRPGQYTNDPTADGDPPLPPTGSPSLGLPLDCAFEQTRNSSLGWQMWNQAPDLPYPDEENTTQSAFLLGEDNQTPTAFHNNGYQYFGAGEEVTFNITSYDWGGRGEVHVMIWTNELPWPWWNYAWGNPPDNLVIRFPVDEENAGQGDDIPDTLEMGALAQDGAFSDEDLDARTPTQHTNRGDGLVAKDETSGIRLKAGEAVKRVSEIDKVSSGDRVGGLTVKDAFV